MSNKLRVIFEKGEGLRYTGHLDILRVFIRGMRRAGLPVKYSEGFSPHAVLTFALPLGVGVTSQCEIVDVSLTEQLDPQLFVDGMNSVMPHDGLRCISAAWTDAAVPAICRAEYLVRIINEGDITEQQLLDGFNQPHLWVDKKSKKKVKQVDLKEHVFEYQVLEAQGDTALVRMVISAGNDFNVKPTLVVEGLQAAVPQLKPQGIMPHRIRFFTHTDLR